MSKNSKIFQKRFWLALMCLFTLMLVTLTACGNSKKEPTTVRVGSLKGPTSMGLVNLMKANEDGTAEGKYEFTMEVQADTLLASMVGGNLDIALVPANVASVLYNKTQGGVEVIDINTLGVLYMISADDSITSVKDLAGKTVYLTGKGTTPDFVLQYLLSENEVADQVTLEYMSEATEVLNAIVNTDGAVGLLPQPFATVALVQNENLKQVIDMTDSWNQVQGDSKMVTGVTIVRKEFLEENEEAVKLFLKEHKASAEKANSDVEGTAELVANYGIIEKAVIAQKAMPKCNITYISGNEMKTALSGYLETISQYDISFIGGSIPEEGFYYIEK